ncbi:MAG: hypothetical protein VX583_04605 [Bdellovibrionota bacterium]|nr:hypothetical protein [Pseudobdellovibrionaceae bacterium]|tara:strand:- start:9713 stop:10579 length:867 start_codon:yes stop_codon:yes gene_type:complete
MKIVIFSILLLGYTHLLKADQIQWLSVPNKLAVFPVLAEGLEPGLKANVWWEFRKTITEDGRFLVASKQFLQMKDTYQARSNLSVKESIFLGEHLQADILISLSLEEKFLVLRSYSAEDGYSLIELREKYLNNLPKEKQLIGLANKLAKNWLKKLIFHGIGSPSTEAGLYSFRISKHLSQDLLDEAKLIRIRRTNTGELFQNSHRSVEFDQLIWVKTEGNLAFFKGSSNLMNQSDKNFLFLDKLASKSFSPELPVEMKQKDRDEEKESNRFDKIMMLLGFLAIVVISL